MRFLRDQWPVLLLLAVLIGGSVYTFTAYVWEETVVDVPLSPVLTRDNWYVAGRYLDHAGFGVERLKQSGIASLIEDRVDASWGTTLLVEYDRQFLSSVDIERLLLWIAHGGHLMLAIETDRYCNDPGLNLFLDNFQVELTPVTPDSENCEQRGIGLLDVLEEFFVHHHFSVRIRHTDWNVNETREVNLEIVSPSRPYLKSAPGSATEPLLAITDDEQYGASVLLHQAYQDGVVTLIQDGIFHNELLQYQDQVFLLAWLLEANESYDVKIIESGNAAPLWRQLLNDYAVALTIALMALVLLIHRLWKRFGPLQQPPVAAGSNLIAHLQARGRFWWRRKEQQALLDPVRQAVLPPEPASLDEKRRGVLAKRAGLSVNEVQEMYRGELSGDIALVRYTRALYRIRAGDHQKHQG